MKRNKKIRKKKRREKKRRIKAPHPPPPPDQLRNYVAGHTYGGLKRTQNKKKDTKEIKKEDKGFLIIWIN